jgi:hypothetical protein
MSNRWFFCLCLFSVAASASELQYFDQKIDYWNEGRAQAPTKEIPSPLVSERGDKGSFPWKTYLDPKNKEFFKEGDYTPPEPFMEVAKDPSDDNLKNWFEFMKRKNELAARLETRMQEYLGKQEGPGLAAQIATRVARNDAKAAPQGRADPSRFRIRMYFDSHCPHCRRMFSVLKRLQDEGYKIEALQIDDGKVPPDENGVPRGRADLAELKSHGGTAVPFLVIADLKRKALLPGIQGYHEYEEVMALIREASRG